MSNIYGDGPYQIKYEGQQITLTATKKDASTYELTWNIPSITADNCVDGRRSYNGIVITYGNKSFSHDLAPIDEQRYTGDPTGDSDLHAGSKIQNTLVVAALYDDVTTTTLTVTDIDTSTPVYFSAFAVDAQLRYHTEGVHSYSLDYGKQDEVNYPGYQQIGITSSMADRRFDITKVKYADQSSIFPGMSTNLLTTGNYDFTFISDTCTEPNKINIVGADAQTYQELLDEVNKRIALLKNPPQSALVPGVGTYYIKDGKLYIFDGVENQQVTNVIIKDEDPTVSVVGEYWYNGMLYKDTGAIWTPADFYTLQYPHSQYQTLNWIDMLNDVGYTLNNEVWCERPLFNTIQDPSVGITSDQLNYTNNAIYWYDSVSMTVKQLIVKPDGSLCWHVVEALYNEIDPNTLTNGYYWFNDTETQLYVLNVATWTAVDDVIYSADEPTPPTASVLWYDTDSNTLKLRNPGNDDWILLNSVVWATEPNVRTDCDLWWNSSNDVLSVWDEINYSWNPVDQFIMQQSNPLDAVQLEHQSLWYVNGVTKQWDGTAWVLVTDSTIRYHKDPIHNLITGTDHYLILETNEWFTGDVPGTSFSVIESDIDPLTPLSGDFWYDDDDQILYMWNGVAWTSIMYVAQDPTPVIGYKYFNTADNILYMWNGSNYIPAPVCGVLKLTSVGDLLLLSETLGSESYITLTEDNLFNSLPGTITIFQNVMGVDGIDGSPSYLQVGVGTDGTPDERRKIGDQILIELGSPQVNVELTRRQLDRAIDIALEVLRERTSSAYRRGMFFLDVQPNTQRYVLTDKRVGFNKVVDVMAAYRMQSSFLGNAAGQGAYGQAMLQHLYQMGQFDLVSYHIVSEYVELLNQMFATYLTFNWSEYERKLSFYQSFGANERILLDVTIERTEQDLMTDRQLKPWIERYSLGQSKLMLAQIRGKFASLPGAGGGISLNATELQTSGETDLEWCEQRIDDYITETPEEYGYNSSFMMG